MVNGAVKLTLNWLPAEHEPVRQEFVGN